MQEKDTKRTTKRTAGKRDRSQTITVDLGSAQRKYEKQADLVLAFLNGPINSFLREAIVEVLAEAARRSGSAILAPALVDGKIVTANQTTPQPNPHFLNLQTNLANLLLHTSMHGFSLRLSGRERVAQAITDILTTEETPASLFNKVADFISEGSSRDIRELWTPPLLCHMIDLVNAKEAQEDEEEKD